MIMPKKPKANRGPVVKTDWVVELEYDPVLFVFEKYPTKDEIKDTIGSSAYKLYIRKWRKIQ